MPKSTYYYEISKVDTVGFRNAELTEEIKKIFDQHKGRYGVRRVYRELLRCGKCDCYTEREDGTARGRNPLYVKAGRRRGHAALGADKGG